MLDCSVALAWCFEDETSDYSESVLNHVRRRGALVPPLWPLEVTNGLLSAVRKDRISLDGATDFLELFSHLPIRIVSIPSEENLSAVFSLSLENTLSTYDGCYLYLSIKQKIQLATLDKELERAGQKYSCLFAP